MNRPGVKMGYFDFLSKSEISQCETFVSQKLGGPDRDRTDDLLHAMHVNFLSRICLVSFYVFEITKIVLWISIQSRPSYHAHTCSRAMTKARGAGGKIGVSRPSNSASLRSYFPTLILSAFFQKIKTISKKYDIGRGYGLLR